MPPEDHAQGRRLGVMFDRDRKPEELTGFARTAEALGLDDLWVVEDLGWAGGVSSATAALAATERLRVGIGIAPAGLRNPALLAMELAAVARMFPGRLTAGVGHGVPGWMRQVGAPFPGRLALLEETITAVRSLLHGETVTLHGETLHLDQVRLVHPPAVPPPVVAGVVQPRSLELSGRVADGTVLAEGQGPERLAAALGHIERGRGSAGTDRPHEAVVFTHLYTADDPEQVATATAPIVDEYAQWLRIAPSEVFLAAGPAATAAERLRSLWQAGAGTVVVRPVGDDPVGQLEALLPALDR